MKMISTAWYKPSEKIPEEERMVVFTVGRLSVLHVGVFVHGQFTDDFTDYGYTPSQVSWWTYYKDISPQVK